MSLSEDLFSTWRPVCCGKCIESRRSLPPKSCALQRRHRGGTPTSPIWTVSASAAAPKTGGDMERSRLGAELRLEMHDLLTCSRNCVSASDEAARQGQTAG